VSTARRAERANEAEAQRGDLKNSRGVSITEITSGRLSWARAFGGRNPLLSDDRPRQRRRALSSPKSQMFEGSRRGISLRRRRTCWWFVRQIQEFLRLKVLSNQTTSTEVCPTREDSVCEPVSSAGEWRSSVRRVWNARALSIGED
jgi:hypothetical protein